MMTGHNLYKIFSAIGARLLVVVLSVFISAFFVRARGNDARVRVTFPFDSAELRPDYMANESSINTLRQLVDATDGELEFEIIAYSSPEGNEMYNKALSARRAASAKSFILSLVPDSNPKVKLISVSEAWALFRSFIASDKTLGASSRSELLLIIDSDTSADEKERLIKLDPNYKRLYQKYFRSLRYADITLNFKNLAAFVPFRGTPVADSPFVTFANGSSKIDLTNKENVEALNAMIAFFREDPSAVDDYVILGAASPEGPTSANNRLALLRAKAIADYISDKAPELKGKLHIRAAGEDWNGLRSAILDEDSLSDSDKQQLCAIIDSNASADEKEAALKNHPAYNTVREKCFGALRRQSIAPAESSSSSSSSSAAAVPVVVKDKDTDKDSANKDIAAMGVSFRNGSSKLDPSYKDNQKALDEMVAFFRENPSAADEYDIVGAASPDGPTSVNDRLARERAQAIANYISEQAPELKDRLHTRSAGEDWDGLRKVVLAEDSLSDKDKTEICKIIDSNASADEKEAALKKHPAYETVRDNCYDPLRRQSIALAEDRRKTTSETSVTTETSVEEPVEINVVEEKKDTILAEEDTVIVLIHKEYSETSVQDTLRRIERLPGIYSKAVKLGEDYPVERDSVVTETEKEYERELNMIAGLKTNLLYDAVTAVNVELELPIWEQTSLNAEFVTPWWETGNKYCFQIQYVSAELRYWFKPWEGVGVEKLRGWFAAPYVAFGQYDFQYDKQINYQGEFWSAGLTAGYSMAIGKRKKANLEFSLSLGYLKSPFRHYYPTDDYSKLIHDPYRDGTRYWLGPTKAKVSLVIPICVPTGKTKEVSND